MRNDEPGISLTLEGTSWDNRRELGFFKSFFLTIQDVLFWPNEFFKHVKVSSSLTSPFLFALVTTLIASVFLTIKDAYVVGIQEPIPLIVTFLLSGVQGVIVLFLSSGVWHLFVMIFGGQAGFRGTFTVFAYGNANSMITAIPLTGMLIARQLDAQISVLVILVIAMIGAWIWAFMILIAGFRHVHQMSLRRATLAYFIPVFLVFAAWIPLFFRLANPENHMYKSQQQGEHIERSTP
ncbi:MAG: YIP1 family protein [Candidatus Omnitrophica bacterium]|nr:YIP1 family protein [Candidatus Omnitrophota bacterium]